MDKRKFTDLVIDIDSVFYRVGDRSLKLISNEVMKNWFNTLKENHNIYLVSNRLDFHEVEKRLKQYKINRIPKEIYTYKEKIDFRRKVVEKLIKYQSLDKHLSKVLFVSGNPYFIKEIDVLGLKTCYVRELNRDCKDIKVGTFSVDRIGAINSILLYQDAENNDVSKKASKVKNLEIADYTYIIGSGYKLLDRKEFNENAIFSRSYNNTNPKDTLAVSSDLLELFSYQRQAIATLFLNNGSNDSFDTAPTFEKKISKNYMK